MIQECREETLDTGRGVGALRWWDGIELRRFYNTRSVAQSKVAAPQGPNRPPFTRSDSTMYDDVVSHNGPRKEFPSSQKIRDVYVTYVSIFLYIRRIQFRPPHWSLVRLTTKYGSSARSTSRAASVRSKLSAPTGTMNGTQDKKSF